MISFKDLYSVLSAVVPLYVTMFLAYASVKWWNVFSPDQCAGINRFVAIFAIPLLSFEVISRINPYKMDFLFIAADGVSKILILLILFFWAKFSKRGSLDWAITIFSISTLPNTLVMGIPLLKSMYGDDKEYLMIQAVVLQCIVWYTLLLFLFEYREARIFILSKFRDASHASNSSTTETTRSSGGESFGGTQEMVVGGGEDEVVRTPSSAQTTPNVNKVAPDSRSCLQPTPAGGGAPAATEEDDKEVHLFIWRCGCCSSQGGVCGPLVQACRSREEDQMKIEGKRGEVEEKPNFLRDQNVAASSTTTSSSSAMLKQILKRVWFKLVRNPNSYASVLGLTWALTSCRWGIKMPQIMENSVTILSDAGLGMAMFSLGLFMALQPRIIACGNRLAAYGMIVRFLAGPAVMAVASVAVGLRGTVLRVAIVQAALPQGIVPFVFSREYNLHPEMLSTAVIFGMIVSLPITILYYVLLGL